MLKALDLFCGAGGATKGLQMAGFQVTGIDINPQPDYCGEFVRADITQIGSRWDGSFYISERRDGGPILWEEKFDFVWASPPCQKHTTLKVMWNAREHDDLIPFTRELLRKSNLPFVVENVIGAPLENPVTLCGSMFDLGVEVYDGWRQLRRHRLFESNFPIDRPQCRHAGATIGIYGDHARDRRRKPGVRERGIDFPDERKMDLGKAAMGMSWATRWKGLSQAIPPAYSHYIAQQFLKWRAERCA